MRVHLIGIWGLAVILFIMIGVLPTRAQDDFRLKLLGVDTSEFPTVRITLLTADEQSVPISDLSQLTLRENGTPVTDISFERIPAGVDVTFIIDANPDIVGVDDESGLTRLEKVQDSIRRFAELYMNPDGLDRVSIIVPGDDGQSGQLLLEDATLPEEVIAAIEAYSPTSLSPTPLNAMLTMALEQIQQHAESDRFHSLLLFSDGRRLSEQLSYTLLTAQASDSNTPIYSAILGAVADEFEIDNVRRLFEPTQATYVHMPAATETDAIYEIWQQQGDQVQIVYRSLQRQNGRNQVNVNLGSALASGSFDLALQAPEVSMQEESVEIHRIGVSPDSALADLQPAVQPLTANIAWPDGLPRALSEVTLLVNDQPQAVMDSLPDQALDTITFDWDISGIGQGDFDLVLTVTDELGYQGSSTVLPARLTSEWPLAPTAVPTTAPMEENDVQSILSALHLESIPLPLSLESIPLPWERLSWLSGDVAAGITGVFLFLLVALFWRNRSQRAVEVNERLQGMLMTPAAEVGETKHEEVTNLIARLEPFPSTPTESIEFLGDNITVGRDDGLADVVIPHESLAFLHARIRHQEREFWLFDEGSTEGTYLNYERLGLAPRMLQDGDVVQFGTVSYRFRLRPEGYQDAAGDVDEVVMDEVVILDMDGLMVDTEPLSRQAWEQVLADLGSEPLDDAFYNTLIGHRLWETAEMLVAHYDLAIEPSELAWRKELLFAEIRSGEVPVMPGLYELLEALKQRGIRWGVATSTPRHVAEENLAKIDVLDSCQALAAGDEVPGGKPEPDVYLLAAERLDKGPAQCLAFEDSPTGCQAARAAGMMVVAIPSDKDMLENFECADHILTSLLDVPGRLDQLLTELRQR